MRILSGIQPSGQLHLGNYFGSIEPNRALLPSDHESFFFIADLHALTTIHDRSLLEGYRHEILLDYLACGFDPQHATIFYQSDVAQHTVLAWILSTLAPMGLLERAVSFKDKVEKGIGASVGLFTYPVLMAADILLYGAHRVPVGQDQKQHLEITRDLAIKFNTIYGETLVIPEPLIREETAVVPGIDGQKMSKSAGNTIPLFADDAVIRKAIMGIRTDSRGIHEPKDPDTCPIFQIHRLFLSPDECAQLHERYRNGLPYGEAKSALCATTMDFLAPLRARRAQIDRSLLGEIANHGAQKASKIAQETITNVRAATGLTHV